MLSYRLQNHDRDRSLFNMPLCAARAPSLPLLNSSPIQAAPCEGDALMPYETWTSKHLAELELLPSDLRGCLGLSDAVLSHPTEVAGFFFSLLPENNYT